MNQPARIVGFTPGSDESLLVDAARGGDSEAFAELYRRHVGRIHALSLRLTGNVDAAETLTQDAFVRAWRKLERFEGRSRFGTWIHRLTVNLALDRRRRAALERSREGQGDPDDIRSVATAPVRSGSRIDLERAIAGLPPGARTVFVLHDVEGYRHREIAQRMGTAVGTVKAQLHRARRLLREALA